MGATFEAQGPDRTKLTISVDIPGMDESTDPRLLTSLMERSIRNITDLVEAET